MTCSICHGTGLIADTTRRLYEPPTVMHEYCDCDAGRIIRARDNEDSLFARECLARDYADDLMKGHEE